MMNIRSYIRIMLSGMFGCLGINGMLLRRRGECLMALAYHRVLDSDSPVRERVEPALITTTSIFERQMALIARQFQPITLSHAVRWLNGSSELPSDAILITFDDGWADTYINAFPIMFGFNIQGNVFLATDFIDASTPYWTDRIYSSLMRVGGREYAIREIDRLKRMSSVERSEKIAEMELDDLPGENLTWAQVREMSENGWEFGSHTRGHIILSHEPHALVLGELCESREEIHHRLGVYPTALAYPDGQYNDTTCCLAAEAGYDIAFTCNEGLCRLGSPRLTLPRLGIHNGICSLPSGSFSPSMFLAYLSGAIPWRYKR